MIYASQIRRNLLLSNNYDEGRHQKPWSGGDWNDYMRGRDDKQRWDDTTSSGNNNGKKGPQIDGGNGSGNNCLGPLIIITLGLIIAIQSFLTAILSGAFLLVLNKRLDLLHTEKKYKSEFSICVIINFIYLCGALVLVAIQKIFFGRMLGMKEPSIIDSFYKYFLAGEYYAYLSVKHLFIFHTLCTCITLLMFRSYFDTVLSARQGTLKLLFVIVGIILPSLIVLSPYINSVLHSIF